jgi:gamma-glutamyltranspeptidase/glutathione hydrolase
VSNRDLSEAKRFPSACVASPHHLASAAGLAVLASGGNAMDAAVATNLVLGVVAPYQCGFGGDLFALVWNDGLHAYNGSGRAPAEATVERVRSAVATAGVPGPAPRLVEMPERGPLTVTVPGAVQGWFELLGRFGSRSFGELAAPALRYAEDGFEPTRRGAIAIGRSKAVLGGYEAWKAVYGAVAAGRTLRQPGLARTIRALAARGPDAYYRGPIAPAIVHSVRSAGGFLAGDDLAVHLGSWVEPLSTAYRDVQIVELPPNTQGVAVLEALNVVEATGDLPRDPPSRQHLLIEAMKLALADRDAFVTDPDHMREPASRLASRAWAAERAGRIDPARAATLDPGRQVVGGTAYVCAADEAGMLVSLIQSNWTGFGSGVHVPDWGINLHNRGAYFSLDPGHANVIGPGKRTLHTLIPAMALREGRPWLVFGTMGGDGQAQTHLQLLARIVDDGRDIQRAIDAPRWLVSPHDWSVTADARFGAAVVDGLRSLGHRISLTPWFDPALGHAHAIRVGDGGYAGATDPRAEGAVMGL